MEILLLIYGIVLGIILVSIGFFLGVEWSETQRDHMMDDLIKHIKDENSRESLEKIMKGGD